MVFICKKTFNNIVKICNPNPQTESENLQSAKNQRIRNPWKMKVFLKPDFCKNPNPILKFDGLTSLLNTSVFRFQISCNALLHFKNISHNDTCAVALYLLIFVCLPDILSFTFINIFVLVQFYTEDLEVTDCSMYNDILFKACK